MELGQENKSWNVGADRDSLFHCHVSRPIETPDNGNYPVPVPGALSIWCRVGLIPVVTSDWLSQQHRPQKRNTKQWSVHSSALTQIHPKLSILTPSTLRTRKTRLQLLYSTVKNIS